MWPWDAEREHEFAECLHGGVDLGETHYGMTLFPQPLGLAAAFDPPMLHEIAGIISEEMRAASNMYRQADGTARSPIPLSPWVHLNKDYPILVSTSRNNGPFSFGCFNLFKPESIGRLTGQI